MSSVLSRLGRVVWVTERNTVPQKKEFFTAFGPLIDCFPNGIPLQIVHIKLLDDGNGASVEMTADSVAKDGTVFKNL